MQGSRRVARGHPEASNAHNDLLGDCGAAQVTPSSLCFSRVDMHPVSLEGRVRQPAPPEARTLSLLRERAQSHIVNPCPWAASAKGVVVVRGTGLLWLHMHSVAPSNRLLCGSMLAGRLFVAAFPLAEGVEPCV